MRHDRAIDFDVDHVARAADAVRGGMRQADADARHRRAVAGNRLFDVDVHDRRERPEDAAHLAAADVAQIDEHCQRVGLARHIRDGLARLNQNRASRAFEARRHRTQLRTNRRFRRARLQAAIGRDGRCDRDGQGERGTRSC